MLLQDCFCNNWPRTDSPIRNDNSVRQQCLLQQQAPQTDHTCCNLTEAFKVFDANKDGFISREELKAVLTKMGEKLSEREFDEMVRVADSNGDGKIDYGEYVNLMCQ